MAAEQEPDGSGGRALIEPRAVLIFLIGLIAGTLVAFVSYRSLTDVLGALVAGGAAFGAATLWLNRIIG